MICLFACLSGVKALAKINCSNKPQDFCQSISTPAGLYSLVPSSIFPLLTPQAKCEVPLLINLMVSLLLTSGQNHRKLHSLPLNQAEETEI